MVEFSTFELERQYVVFICGNEYREPPALHLVEPFSKRGKTAIPMLKMKLEATRNQLAIRDIVYVLSEMNWRKTYNVSDDKELMQLMKSRASEIKDDFWRQYTQKMIAEMGKGTH